MDSYTQNDSFMTKGNILELAIGVMIAAAFQAIITSLVKDIISPLIGLAATKNFDELYVTLRRPSNMTKADDPASVEAAIAAGLNIMTYGHFITAVFTFLITGKEPRRSLLSAIACMSGRLINRLAS